MSAITDQVKRMVISTYQAASGAGQAAMDELELQTKEVLEGKEVTKNVFPFQVRQKHLPFPGVTKITSISRCDNKKPPFSVVTKLPCLSRCDTKKPLLPGMTKKTYLSRCDKKIFTFQV